MINPRHWRVAVWSLLGIQATAMACFVVGASRLPSTKVQAMHCDSSLYANTGGWTSAAVVVCGIVLMAIEDRKGQHSWVLSVATVLAAVGLLVWFMFPAVPA